MPTRPRCRGRQRKGEGKAMVVVGALPGILLCPHEVFPSPPSSSTMSHTTTRHDGGRKVQWWWWQVVRQSR